MPTLHSVHDPTLATVWAFYCRARSMRKGGVTSMDMKKYGRNLARAMNQKASSK